MASKLLNNACGTRAPDGAFRDLSWDVLSVQTLLKLLPRNPIGVGLRPRFTEQALREAIRSVWHGQYPNNVQADFSQRLEILQDLVPRYPFPLLSGAAFVGIACQVIRHLYTIGTPGVLRWDLDVDNGGISAEQFVQAINVFVDAGMVFSLPSARELLWVKQQLVNARVELENGDFVHGRRYSSSKEAEWTPIRLQYIDAILPALSMIDENAD